MPEEAWSSERAFAEILSLDGKSFDPAVVSAFVRLYERGEIERVRLAAASEEPLSDDTPVLDRVPMPDRLISGHKTDS